MEEYIRYKRFTKQFDNVINIQSFFDELITDGWQIISYNEQPMDVKTLSIIVVAGIRKEKV